MMKTNPGGSRAISVRSSQGRYPVWVGAGVLPTAGKRVRRVCPDCRRIFVVSSPRVWRLWGDELRAGLKRAGIAVVPLLMNDREEKKRLATMERLAEKLLQHGADRSSVLAALGGGVVGDVTGYLAASYMRGIACVQIPTTLVAQIDSAIGGKTGVNLREGKNLLGAFHPPLAVLADVGTLATLSERDYRAGFYEVIKCAAIGDAQLFQFLENNLEKALTREPKSLKRSILAALQVKARIVERDEREQGVRQKLNFGHTIGHALEASTGYRGLRHGEAVGWGMLVATRLAERLGLAPPQATRRIDALVRRVGSLPKPPGLPPARLYRQLFADKKKREDDLRFVLPRRIGRVEIVGGIARDEIEAALREVLSLRAAP